MTVFRGDTQDGVSLILQASGHVRDRFPVIEQDPYAKEFLGKKDRNLYAKKLRLV